MGAFIGFFLALLAATVFAGTRSVKTESERNRIPIPFSTFFVAFWLIAVANCDQLVDLANEIPTVAAFHAN
jgi:hypothetical protein